MLAYLLVWRGLPALQVESDPLDVLLKDVVVEESPECGGGARAARLDEEAANVAGDKVVVEEDVLVVLDVEQDGRLASAEVAVKADAVVAHLVALHRDDGVQLARRSVMHRTSLVVLEHTAG